MEASPSAKDDDFDDGMSIPLGPIAFYLEQQQISAHEDGQILEPISNESGSEEATRLNRLVDRCLHVFRVSSILKG